MAEIDIFGTLNNATPEGVIAKAEQIKDATQNKKQSEINADYKKRIETLEENGGGGGTGGTTDYNDLDNKPQIGGVELSGNKTLEELGVQPKGEYALKTEIPDTNGLVEEAPKDGQNYVRNNGQWAQLPGGGEGGTIVVDSELSASSTNPVQNKVIKDYVDKRTNELNISLIFPNSGIDGTNKYTLETAILQVPTEYRKKGITISFYDESANLLSYTNYGGSWTTNNFKKVGVSRFDDIEKKSGDYRILPWNTDVATTRKQIPQSERKVGMLLCYKSNDTDFIIEQYIGVYLYDNNWVDSRSWKLLPNYNDIETLRTVIPLRCLYHKDIDLSLHPSNFSKFGYYNSIESGTKFTLGVATWSVNWSAIFIYVKTGITYTVSNAGGPDGNRKIVMTNAEGLVTHGINNTESEITAVEGDVYLVVPNGAEVKSSETYEVLSDFERAKKLIDSLSQEIQELRDQIGSSNKEFSTMNIPYIFGMVNSKVYSREYVVRLFPESFIDNKPDAPVLINNRRDVAISRQAKTDTLYEKLEKNITLSANGYANKDINIDFHVLNEKVFANKNIRLSLFGVSFDSIDYRNDDGSNEEGGTTTSALLEKYIRMSAKDNAYTVNYVSIGTVSHKYGDTFNYEGDTLNSRGKNEARGGHNGICYLRQPMNFSVRNIDYDPNVSGTSATGLIQWLMNGLKYRIPYNQEYSTSGTDYGDFAITEDNLKALRYTPFGKYHHDYAEELWEFCNKKGWIVKVSGSYSAWTGSEEQKQIIDKCMDYVAENPDYPFYDRDTARETSYTDGIAKDVLDKTQYALNYNKYLERYRTIDDLGVRLFIEDENPAGKSVQGSDGQQYTIGTHITTQELLNDYDVCKPTHVIWDMFYNDWPYYTGQDSGNKTGVDAFEMTELFVAAIKQQLGDSIIFGLKAKKQNGAFYPDVWGDICLCQQYDVVDGDNNLISYNKLAMGKYADLSQKVSWIPIFPASIPFATNYTQEFGDFVYSKVLVCSVGTSNLQNSDSTHEGLRSAKSMTYQIYGWLGYTVK